MNAPRIVFSKDDTLFLDTSMTQSAFANSRLSERLAEQGVTAENKNNEWTFAPWTFTGTMVSADSSVETVLLEGTGFDGCTLKEYFDEAGKDTSAEAQAAVAVCSAINCAIKSGQKLPNNGAGGIFISTAKDRIIFVPEDLFETAAACRGETAYSENEGMGAEGAVGILYAKEMKDPNQAPLVAQKTQEYKDTIMQNLSNSIGN